MNTLDYIERETRFTFGESVKAYADTHERIVKLLTLLLGLSGVLISALVSLYGKGVPTYLTLFASLTAFGWLGIGLWLAFRGLQSNRLSNGPTPYDLATKIDAQPDGWFDVLYPNFKGDTPEALPGGALANIRRNELSVWETRIQEYHRATSIRARMLNRAYLWMILVPFAAAEAAFVAWLRI